MNKESIQDIVIVGGGTAGWMTAAALSKQLGTKAFSIRLIESEQIGTVGVGEATIPQITYFNRLLGVDERRFLAETKATFKLGIEFVNWGKLGDNYIHPFGPYGMDMQGVHFHHSWLRQEKKGRAKPIDEFSLPNQAARANKFQHGDPSRKNSPLSMMAYAYQFDATLYAGHMRRIAEENGVLRIEGKITRVTQDTDSGYIKSVELEDDRAYEGDLFIDCSGFTGLLIEQTLKTGYDDWSHYLPCNRAVTRLSERLDTLPPYTRATAKTAGWQWRIPLQSRTGNGYVYCDKFQSDDEALASLNEDLDTEAIAPPKFLKFQTGIRKQSWNKNVIAIGLAAGFLEPLESTSIHLIQTAIARLMTNFPDKSFNKPDIDYFNQRTQIEYEQIRDFLVLHYHATTRDDSPFWDYCRTMEIPKTLKNRIAIYRENARLYRDDNELFTHISWFAVLNGQGIKPQRYHPLADILDDEKFEGHMNELHRVTQNCVTAMPNHEEYLMKLCEG